MTTIVNLYGEQGTQFIDCDTEESGLWRLLTDIIPN